MRQRLRRRRRGRRACGAVRPQLHQLQAAPPVPAPHRHPRRVGGGLHSGGHLRRAGRRGAETGVGAHERGARGGGGRGGGGAAARLRARVAAVPRRVAVHLRAGRRRAAARASGRRRRREGRREAACVRREAPPVGAAAAPAPPAPPPPHARLRLGQLRPAAAHGVAGEVAVGAGAGAAAQQQPRPVGAAGLLVALVAPGAQLGGGLHAGRARDGVQRRGRGEGVGGADRARERDVLCRVCVCARACAGGRGDGCGCGDVWRQPYPAALFQTVQQLVPQGHSVQTQRKVWRAKAELLTTPRDSGRRARAPPWGRQAGLGRGCRACTADATPCHPTPPQGGPWPAVRRRARGSAAGFPASAGAGARAARRGVPGSLGRLLHPPTPQPCCLKAERPRAATDAPALPRPASPVYTRATRFIEGFAGRVRGLSFQLRNHGVRKVLKIRWP